MKCAHWLSVIIVATIVGGCQPTAPEVVIDGRTMGTTWTVRLSHCPLPDCPTVLRPLLEKKLRAMNAVFSHFDAGSELSRFNAHTGPDWFSVSEELIEVVQLGEAISELSGGAFDMTVAPAVDAWGFGATEAHPQTLAGQPAQTIAVAGHAQLQTRLSPPALRKLDPALRIDAAAIAKGYAVDQLAYLLEGMGVTDYLVEIGGEIRTAGNRPDNKPWRIGIEPPDVADKSQPTIEYIVVPGNNAVASSGDYRNFYMLDDKRISHTIDPATAAPVDNTVAAVSVIAPSAAQADALATAMLVLGVDDGLSLAEGENLAAMFTERSAAGLRTRYTTAFAQFLLNP